MYDSAYANWKTTAPWENPNEKHAYNDENFIIIEWNKYAPSVKTNTEFAYIIYYNVNDGADYYALMNELEKASSRRRVNRMFKKYGALFWWEAMERKKYQYKDDNVFIFTNFEQAKKCLEEYVMPLFIAGKLIG